MVLTIERLVHCCGTEFRKTLLILNSVPQKCTRVPRRDFFHFATAGTVGDSAAAVLIFCELLNLETARGDVVSSPKSYGEIVLRFPY